MRFAAPLAPFLTLALCATPAASQSVDAKAKAITDVLMRLCLAGGSQTEITAEGNLELRAKITDVLTGNLGVTAGARPKFNKTVWEGIIGGISKDMTSIQAEQADAARKCMIDHGFPLIERALEEKH
jgi:hypothetical protein